MSAPRSRGTRDHGKPIVEAMARASSKMAPSTPAPAPEPLRLSQAASASDSEMEESSQAAKQICSKSHTALLKQFEAMLQKALQSTSRQITDRLSKEIRDIGQRTAVLEDKYDDLSGELAAHDRELDALRDENLTLHSKLEDMENRSRRSNIRIRGLPEHITDLFATAMALFQELSPDIPPERLEIERVHRALTRRRPDGSPRDILVKLLYYRTKETLLSAARTKSSQTPLIFQGHEYQLYTDIAPSTIAKRRAMKPCLDVLKKHNIPYKWGFPFRLIFTYRGKSYTSTSTDEASHKLSILGLTDGGPSTSAPRDPATSTPKRSRSDSDPNQPGGSGSPATKSKNRSDNPG